MRRVVIWPCSQNAGEPAKWFEDHGYAVRCYALDEKIPEDEAADIAVILVEPEKAMEAWGLAKGTGAAIGQCPDRDYDGLAEFIARYMDAVQNVRDAFAAALERGETKRLAFVTDLDSSIALCTATEGYPIRMAKAGVNLLAKMSHNALRPRGYTVRVFARGPETGGMSAGAYIAADFCYDPKEPFVHSEENHLRMRDARFVEQAW